MPTPVQSHLDNYPVSVTLGGQPQDGVVLDFSKILVIDTLAASPLAGMSPTTIGSHASKVVSIGRGDTIPSSGAISAFGKVILERIFGATDNPPETVLYASVDLVGEDTYNDVATLLHNANYQFYAVVSAIDTVAAAALAGEAFNQAGMSHPVYNGLSDISVAGAAAATFDANAVGVLSTALKDQIYLTYHNLNGTTEADFAEIASLYATVDWDNKAAGGNLVLTRTAALGALTSTQKANLDDNDVNHALPGFSTSTYIDEGNMVSGRPVYHIYTRDWLVNRIRNAVAAVKEDKARRKQKLPISREGQQLVLNALLGVMANAERAEHTLPKQDAIDRGLLAPYVRAEAITAEDITARRMRFTILCYYLEDARQIPISLYVNS